jgi:general stress protein 26
MTQPVTELDARFSDPAAVAADWDQTRRTLEDAELFWIATVRADGRPHATPLVAVWLDDAIYFATGFGEQKAVNLRTNQNVILMTGFSPRDIFGDLESLCALLYKPFTPRQLWDTIKKCLDYEARRSVLLES